jgi:hypothetical protein
MHRIRFLLLFEAATFAAAALIHFGVIAAGHEPQKAGVAESALAARRLLQKGQREWIA